jgi:uncharacterized membrane protein
LAYAVLGGVFLAFSDFIMRALDRVGEPAGVDTIHAVVHWNGARLTSLDRS